MGRVDCDLGACEVADVQCEAAGPCDDRGRCAVVRPREGETCDERAQRPVQLAAEALREGRPRVPREGA